MYEVAYIRLFYVKSIRTMGQCIGARHDKLCANIRTLDGQELACVEEIRYLGVFIVRSFKFKCIDQAKKSCFIVLPIVSLQKPAD